MATWHQQRAKGVKLYHETEWTVVEDPPNQCRTLSRFNTKTAADTYLDNLKRLGKAEHAYILKPASEYRATPHTCHFPGSDAALCKGCKG
jgi:hypothetical protein